MSRGADAGPVTAPPDAAVRERALDPSRSFIVKAPAGSGKTSLLVARYLSLLAGASRPEEVLAITFTRKATGEMRARVLDALAGAAAGGEPAAPEGSWPRRMARLAAAAAARDSALGWNLLDNPQRLSVHTIDALCASLARRLPVLSGMGGALSPVEDPLPLYRAAARRTLEALDDADLGPPVLRTLDHLDGNMGTFEDLLAQMLARRDQWMRYLEMDDPQRRRRELEAGLAEVVEAKIDGVRRALDTAVAAPAASGLVSELASLGAFAAGRADALGVEPALLALAGPPRLPGSDGESLPAWKALASLLLTGKGDLRRRPLGKIFTAKDTREAYDRMSALLDALGAAATGPGASALVPALSGLRELPAPRYDDEQWHTLVDLFQVLRLAVAALRVEFARRGESDFPEQVAAAAQALGDEQAPTDLALALDYRIRHLLVDEFQDTSAAHFDVVRRLTAGWAAGDGHTLFLVGDPMQSIYRFREAEVGLFIGCYGGRRESGPSGGPGGGSGGGDGGGDDAPGALDAVALEPGALSANFRSRPEIVDWVNAVFPDVLAPEDDPARAAVAYEASRAVRAGAHGAGVQVHALAGGDPAVAAERVAQTVAGVRERDPGHSVAILLRSRAQGPAIAAALRARGLVWRGVDLEPLSRVPAVQDLHALCCALLHPLDRVSWLAVLRAPWCGLALDDLEAIAGDEPRAPLPDLLGRDATARRLSADGRARFGRVAPVLLEAAARIGRDPLARLLARSWRALGGPACLAGAPLADAQRYLALVAELERDAGAPDPDELARRAGALYSAPAAGDVDVEIMTIHKAKGLEFDVVLLPGLERTPARDRRALLAWSETAAPSGSRLLLAPLPPPEGEDGSPLHGFVRRIEQDKRELETARLLYVACTRAKEALHLFASVDAAGDDGSPPAPRGDSLLAHLWPALGDRFRDPPAAPVQAAATPPGAGILRLPRGWRAPPPPAALAGARDDAGDPVQAVEFEWAGQRARQVGVVAHGLLRRIGEDGADGWDDARVDAAAAWARGRLRGLGVAADDVDEACAAVLDALHRTLHDPRGRWLLDAGHADARSEYALSGIAGGVLVNAVLDRTFVDADGVRWIVDYKTGRHAGGAVEEFLDREQARYRGQLERYAALMQALDPRPVRLALYFPAMSGWREWPFEGGP